jgi:ATP-dependent DNA helicase RecG
MKAMSSTSATTSSVSPTARSYREALEALRRPLDFVARDGFKNIDVVRDLGATLGTAASKLSPHLPKERRERLSAWARDVARWDKLPRSERERLIAAGLRLCAMAVVDAPPEPEAPPPSRIAHEGRPELAATLEGLPGVGPVTFSRLRERGLSTVGDVLHFLPRRWDDLRALVPVGALVPGKPQMTRGSVARVRVIPAWRRRILEVGFTGDDGAPLTARWFHFRGKMQDRFPVGARFLIVGTPKPWKQGLEVVHPETIAEGDGGDAPTGVRVRYPEIEGVPGRLIAKLCAAVCEKLAPLVPDGIPREIVEKHGLGSQAEALRELHLPPAELTADEIAALNDGVSPAQRRLIFDEFFFLQLGLARRRGQGRREHGIAMRGGEAAVAKFLGALPFAPTGAQKKAIGEIARDLAEPHPMHRLLQGDVGSGKTVVAWASCELACAAGFQAAVMAPTELLAEQHMRTLEPWAKATGRSLALLTASTPRPARESTLALLGAGTLDVVVGTHALIAERVAFARLGLVVIDEQHRFGVAQRALLRDKGGLLHEGARAAPHLLVMTATPIPRTLALTAYGDLDITLLDEMPPGREPAKTKVLGGKGARERALHALRLALDEDRQAYWVCPLVEESEKLDLADVTAAAEWLRGELDCGVGLVHGRLPTAERDEVMRRFRAGELRVLVATTVIEVGVDVPAASMMIIEGAERFGLAQLHQLRGRIGRGGGRSTCLLVTNSRAGDAGERLAVMEETADGFVVAEADLRIRGPGELFGTRQAGLPRLRYADLVRDAGLLREARTDAFALLERDPDLTHHPETAGVLEARWAEARLFGEEAG